MFLDALIGQLGEAGIEFRGQGGGGVVVLEKPLGLLFLVCVVNGARGQIAGIDTVAVTVQVDLAGRAEIGGKGFYQTHEAGGGEFSRIVVEEPKLRLKDMEGMPIAYGPRHKGE